MESQYSRWGQKHFFVLNVQKSFFFNLFGLDLLFIDIEYNKILINIDFCGAENSKNFDGKNFYLEFSAILNF
jgi:hypothetical protein